jgi:hypothetical protein
MGTEPVNTIDFTRMGVPSGACTSGAACVRHKTRALGRGFEHNARPAFPPETPSQ